MLDSVRKRDEPWDVIVIGGGAAGAGSSIDAVSRGLDVLLLEQDDFGKGTSSRSTKLVHGGVRYLEQGNIRLVMEALRERGILREIASEYVSDQAFVVPCYSRWDVLYYGLGLKIYDLLSGRRSFGKSEILNRKRVVEALPGIKPEGLSGGIRYHDGSFDDTRLLFAILRKAASMGATVINYAKVEELKTGAGGRVESVKFRCAETGETFEPRAKSVINATGAFADAVRNLASNDQPEVLVRSRGVHLVFEAGLTDGTAALMVPKTSDGRVLFAIPFYGRLLVGTTDTPVKEPSLEPVPAEEEIDFILETCAAFFVDAPQRSDIKSMFAGIRPLFGKKRPDGTASLSRSHKILADGNGLITVAGGKWTTYRKIAEDAVNKAIETGALAAGPAVTSELKLGRDVEFDPRGLEEKLSPRFEWTFADVVRTIRFEMARTVEDVLARRTRILFLDAEEAVRVAPITAELLAAELGYGTEWIEKQVDAFERTASGYRVSR